jgi:hypothetical protein
VDLQHLRHEHRSERQCQIAVDDRAAERPGLGPRRIDMDPLMVAGSVREGVHLVLGDLDPVGRAQLHATQGQQALGRRDRRRHAAGFLLSL